MWPKTFSRLIGACALWLLALRLAMAQPAMPDPSQMSGIPRPDPNVASGTVTVRLIRGELQNRIVDATVELFEQDKSDKPGRSAKTDGEGRATFSSLPAAMYTARATVDGKTLSSQRIEVAAAPAPGVRVMLVFPKSLADQQKELGKPDGKARSDAQAPAGTLIIKAVAENGQPLAGLGVTVLRASRATEKVEALPQKTTDADGTARYSGLPFGPELGYLASVHRDGADQRSEPFQLAEDHGSVVALTVYSVSHHDLGSLYIGQGSHAIFEPQDDVLRVMENLILVNPTPQPVDPGPAGLRIALAADALSPQVLPGGPARLSIDATHEGAPAALWQGPIPPGQTVLSVAFILKQHGSVQFRQVASLRYENLLVGIAKLPTLRTAGLTNNQERPLNGRIYIVASAMVPGPGGTIEFSLSGLPTDFYVLRIIGAVCALAIALVFAYLSLWRAQSATTEEEEKQQYQKLLARRETLLDELLRAESVQEPRVDKKGKPRSAEQIRTELEDIYRKLDESNAV